ncbi:MAG: hypothetical protein K6A65_01250, partial [Succinivibrionaceae bacterium]|nr:hypothetical protein [Succinivibrionaceae bacterium]
RSPEASAQPGPAPQAQPQALDPRESLASMGGQPQRDLQKLNQELDQRLSNASERSQGKQALANNPENVPNIKDQMNHILDDEDEEVDEGQAVPQARVGAEDRAQSHNDQSSIKFGDPEGNQAIKARIRTLYSNYPGNSAYDADRLRDILSCVDPGTDLPVLNDGKLNAEDCCAFVRNTLENCGIETFEHNERNVLMVRLAISEFLHDNREEQQANAQALNNTSLRNQFFSYLEEQMNELDSAGRGDSDEYKQLMILSSAISEENTRALS